MPYGQNPQIQQTLEDISRGRYRSRKKGGGTVAGTVLANRFAKQQDEDITSVRQFNQSLDQARALEGMASPTPTRSKINLGIGRSLEGMRQEGSVGFGPDAMGKRNLSDVMERFGDPQFGAVFRQPELRLQGEGGKEMVEFARDDPRLFAELLALSTIQAGSKVGASTSRALGGGTRGDEPLDLLSAINELSSRVAGQQPIRQGTIEFMRPEFRKEPTAGERIEVGSYFIPGFGPLGGITRGVAKAAKATKVMRLTPEQHASLLTEGLNAKATRPGRGLAATLAANVKTALRRPPAGEKTRLSPNAVADFVAEDVVALAEKSPNIMTDNIDYINQYRSSSMRPSSIFIHAHPPGISPEDVSVTKPDHISSGVLNELESKVNGFRRKAGQAPLTRYRDIIQEGIELAKQGKFGKDSWNSKLAEMSLDEATKYLGAVGVEYY